MYGWPDSVSLIEASTAVTTPPITASAQASATAAAPCDEAISRWDGLGRAGERNILLVLDQRRRFNLRVLQIVKLCV